METTPAGGLLDKPAGERAFYWPCLDGLRAVSVFAVLFYHADLRWIPGGFMGVEVFFVISGFLITSLLLKEYAAKNSVSLTGFWTRRAKRLLPAMVAMVALASVLALAFATDAIQKLQRDLLPLVFYFTNWWQIITDQSYFDMRSRPSMVRHTWSLAVEEQFYFVYPIIFIACKFVFRNRRVLPAVLFSLATCGSVLLMQHLIKDPRTWDASRVYLGSDTRASGLLAGCALAFASADVDATWPDFRAPRWLSIALDLLGVGSIAALTVLFLFIRSTAEITFQAGFAAIDVLSMLAIIAAVRQDTFCTNWILGTRPVVWLGRRSYSIYLYHWPIYVITRPGLDVPFGDYPVLVVRLAVTVGLAALSYQYFEEPIRKLSLDAVLTSRFDDSGLRGLLGTGGMVIAILTILSTQGAQHRQKTETIFRPNVTQLSPLAHCCFPAVPVIETPILNFLGSAQSPIRPGDVVHFFGDSLTAGSGGVDPNRPTFVTTVEDHVKLRNATVVNHGFNGGWTASFGLPQGTSTVIGFQYGMGDTGRWRQDGSPGEDKYLKELPKALADAINICKQAKVPLFVLSPLVVGERYPTNNFPEADSERITDELYMNKTYQVYERVTRENGVPFIDVYRAEIGWKKAYHHHVIEGIPRISLPSGINTVDGLHPGIRGSIWMAEYAAYGILQALGHNMSSFPPPPVPLPCPLLPQSQICRNETYIGPSSF